MKRRLLAIAFLTTVATVLFAAHLYIAQRLVFEPALPAAMTDLLVKALTGAAILLILQPIAEQLLAHRFLRFLSWPAYVWSGFAFLFLVTLLISDVTWTLLGAAVPGSTGPGVGVVRMRAFGIAGLVFGAGALGLREALRMPQVRRVEIALPRWPRALDGFRIVQISDIHIGPLLGRNYTRRLVERVNAVDRDLVVITGDVVDGRVHLVGPEVEPLRGLNAPHGVYFVTGNHDFYSGADSWSEFLTGLGIRALRNRHETIRAGDAAFDLAGVEDHHAHLVSRHHREDLDAALRDRDATQPVILLAHDPLSFPRAVQAGVDLQLSGHTHGGQLWPFKYLVRMTTPFVAGLHRRGSSALYVSRGTGFWGPPMRLFAPAEITQIVLRRA